MAFPCSGASSVESRVASRRRWLALPAAAALLLHGCGAAAPSAESGAAPLDAGPLDAGPRDAATPDAARADAVVCRTGSGTSGVWEPAPDMPGARACHSSAAVGGKIFVFGGLRADGPVTSVGENNQLTDVLVFDPCGAAWTKRNPMPHPRSCASASLLGDQIAIVGGFTNAPVRDADSTLLYDPATDTWSTLGGLTQPRAHLSAATAGGRLLAIGGYDGTTVALRSVEAFDASANAWSQVGLLATGRWSLGAAVVGGAVVVAGGSGPGGDGGLNALASVEQLSSPFADSSLLPAMPFGRTSPAVTALGDTVYVIGGTNVDHTPSNLTSVARLPASTGKWEEVAALRQNRSGATAVALGGQVYVLGGNKNAVTVSSCTGDCTIGSLASVEVFTP